MMTMKKFDEEPLIADGLADDKARKTKSIVHLKQEQAARRAAHAVAVREYGLLCNFIRLVDYMVVQNVIHLAVGWQVCMRACMCACVCATHHAAHVRKLNSGGA